MIDQVDSLKSKLLAGDRCPEEKNTESLKQFCPLDGENQEPAAKEASPKPPEDASSAKSNVYDWESPRLTEPGNSSLGLDHESSEFEDGIGESLLAPYGYLPKNEDGYNCGDPPAPAVDDYASCSFGLSSEDHPFWNWTY